ncbi:hypothetical protein MJO29_012897 [Puccinia striiformis f. sp. tritici]|uniref:Uncharacterized protein n=1 Tax=Puccinia striiformis f. sp. tritici PST-78 TaxID=1165861 RepID=A0A0L0VEA7_9BASI|nr:hypothetical protein Pst134EB_025024 [Puccinia striiformis f. sp. tritici]KAI7943053.1 hypothetical protein MJO29_012897 [Puccinia striiformis f. sp. tritici]KAI9614496.1 hypothetical protein KEM48_005961 [Puccinia striiformis f. sp. tritici PST-130]KNE97329.1 hypothetical protein PSTG_09440 [Puccinia striiformis f. sp. tritici PST-78]
MRFTFLALSFFLLILSCQASSHYIDPPTNSTNTIQSFSFKREFSLSNQDFEVTQDDNNAHILSVETHLKNKLALRFALDLIKPDGERVGVKVNGRKAHCNFDQTYKISNGVQLLFKTEGAGIDRWFIKKSGYIKQQYKWERHLRRLSGVVKGEDGRKVAYFSTKTWGSDFLAAISHSKWPQVSKHTIKTNGDVPLEILVALFASAAVRKDKCGW